MGLAAASVLATRASQAGRAPSEAENDLILPLIPVIEAKLPDKTTFKSKKQVVFFSQNPCNSCNRAGIPLWVKENSKQEMAHKLHSKQQP